MPLCHCLNCGHRLDGASGLNSDNKPRPGDWSVCIQCGSVAVFDRKLRLRLLTDNERNEIVNDPRILVSQMAVAHLHRKQLH